MFQAWPCRSPFHNSATDLKIDISSRSNVGEETQLIPFNNWRHITVYHHGTVNTVDLTDLVSWPLTITQNNRTFFFFFWINWHVARVINYRLLCCWTEENRTCIGQCLEELPGLSVNLVWAREDKDLGKEPARLCACWVPVLNGLCLLTWGLWVLRLISS